MNGSPTIMWASEMCTAVQYGDRWHPTMACRLAKGHPAGEHDLVPLPSRRLLTREAFASHAHVAKYGPPEP